jgi:hypothetical protein
VHDDFFAEQSKTVEGFARQFYSPGSRIRLMKYNLKHKHYITHGVVPLTVIEISSIEFLDDSESCDLFELPHKLINIIKFSDAAVKGFILFDDRHDDTFVNSMFSKLTDERKLGLNIYRVKNITFSTLNCRNNFEDVTDVCVRKWKVLRFIGVEFFHKLCKGKILD